MTTRLNPITTPRHELRAEKARRNREAALAALALSVAAAAAQEGEEPGPARAHAGLALDAVVPVGEFSDFVDTGFGLAGSISLDLPPTGVLGLRLDAAWARYGSVTRRVPLSPTVPFIDVELQTDNSIATVAVGPQLTLPAGGVRAFVHGGIGFSYFVTRSSVRGTSEDEDFASTTNFDDFELALVGGAGTWIRLSGGRTPLHLLLEADYVRNGEASYLREGDLQEGPGGTTEISPVHSDADFLSLRIGLGIGLR